MTHNQPVSTLDLETSKSAHFAALGFVMLLPSVVTVLYFIVFSGSALMVVIYSGSKLVQFAFPLVWVCWIQKRKVRPTKPDMLSIKWGVLFGVFGVIAGLAAYYGYFKSSPHFEQAPKLIGAKLLDMQVTSPAIYLAFAVFLSVPHSLLEEYYWRWFAFGELRRVCDTNLALLVTSLAFMSHHVIVIHQFIQGPWWLTAFLSSCVALGGCVWAWLYDRYGSLYGAWISHLLIDCGIMFIGYDLVSWG